ncbi:hypothetical protein PMAYCL1PPCAC_08135, partial [Pristionchus mayeri]
GAEPSMDGGPPLGHIDRDPSSEIDFSHVLNPFFELLNSFPGEIRNRTAPKNILTIQDNDGEIQAIPAARISPFDVLHPISSAKEEECAMNIQWITMMKKLYERLYCDRFKTLVGHLFPRNLKCDVCETSIKMRPHKLVHHITSKGHARKMNICKLIYPLEATSFWIHTMRIAQRKGPWFNKEFSCSVVPTVDFSPTMHTFEEEFPPLPLDHQSPQAMSSPSLGKSGENLSSTSRNQITSNMQLEMNRSKE